MWDSVKYFFKALLLSVVVLAIGLVILIAPSFIYAYITLSMGIEPNSNVGGITVLLGIALLIATALTILRNR